MPLLDRSRTRGFLTLLCFALFSEPTGAQGSAASLSGIVARAKNAVVVLKTYDAGGRAVGEGSAFRVSGGRFVTNAHVLTGAARVELFDHSDQLLGSVTYAEVVSTTVDLAVLPRVGSGGVLALASAKPQVGDRIVVIGAPEGLNSTVSDGIVSAVRRIDGQNLIQVTAPISSGSSGGPVLNLDGEVVGVSAAMLRDGQNLNFAIPVADVQALLNSPPSRIEFPREGAVFSRRARQRSTPSLASYAPLRVGQTIRAAISQSDETYDSGKHFDGYEFQASRTERLQISVRSSAFDAYVAAYHLGPDSAVSVASDDDSGGGLDAQAEFDVVAGRQYVIFVNAVSETETLGDYVLRLQSASSGSVGATAGSADDRWVRTGGASNFSNYFDRTRVRRLRPSVYEAWERRVYVQPETDESGDTYDVDLVLTEVDCARFQYRTMQLIQYLRGAVVYSSNWSGSPAWHAAVPGSVGESSNTRVCEFARSNVR